MVDPSLLQSFSEDEWMSIHGIPHVHALCFGITLEGLFTCLASLALWGKSGTDFIHNTSRRVTSVEIAPLAILVTDGIGKGRLGMINTFCRTDQAKVKPLDVLSALVQQDSPEPGIVMMKVFANSAYFLQGSFSSPYLDVTTLPWGL